MGCSRRGVVGQEAMGIRGRVAPHIQCLGWGVITKKIPRLGEGWSLCQAQVYKKQEMNFSFPEPNF
jgi:hypothetical protein